MRLDRFVSHATGLSRSEAQKVIRSGMVTVDDSVVRQVAHSVSASVRIALEGESITAPVDEYLMMHKPAGYVCATEDASHPTVLDLIDRTSSGRFQLRLDLQIVGRLDMDTTGILLLTTDGDWNHRITSPRSSCAKTYEVTLADPIGVEAIAQLESGIMLRSEERPTKPCLVEVIDNLRVRITIQEGRYHQVKRMFAAVGNRVITLHRSQVGQLRLDPSLQPGEWRPLSTQEIHLF